MRRGPPSSVTGTVASASTVPRTADLPLGIRRYARLARTTSDATHQSLCIRQPKRAEALVLT